MSEEQQIWRLWAQKLHSWGLQHLVAALLEAAGPLSFLGAQLLYLGQPVLNLLVPETHLMVMANLFEDNSRIKQFAAYLREEPAK